jgi:hypothetical protein
MKQPDATSHAAAWKFYSGLFLVTACTLMLQVVHTRILSVASWYHLAFFAVSMAMFGLTAGAVWLYLRRDRFTGATLSYDLACYGMAFAVSIALGLMVQMTLSPMIARSLAAVWTWFELALCIAVPFFFSGVVVSLALTRSPFPIGRVYAVDLLGAAAGCLGVLALLNLTDAPSVLLWCALIAALGAWLFTGAGVGTRPSSPSALDWLVRRRAGIAAGLALFALLNGMTPFGFQPLVVKGKFEDGNTHIFREWNTFSRISVRKEVTEAPHMWGPSPLLPPELKVTRRRLNIDGDAGSPAYRFTGDMRDIDFLKYDITTLAYHLPDREKTAVIGVGGGRDILSAALFGSRDITAVEINPLFVKLLTGEPRFAEFTNIHRLPGVRFAVDEGRSWFARSDERFDLIQMSLIDTWAATGAGAFSLTENGLYTVEAWKIFLSHLTDRGVYTVSRWYNRSDPSETGRMLSLAVAALMEAGVRQPARHIFLARQRMIATIIVARQPLPPAYIRALHEAVDLYRHQTLISPAMPVEIEPLRTIVNAAGRDELDRFTAAQPFDLTPATDDRPFFFNQLPLNNPVRALHVAKGLVGFGDHKGGVRGGNLVATATLLVLFLIALALVLATIVIPLRSALRDVGRRFVVGGTAYFMLIGIGFMMVEIGLIQRMGVFLGHPVYSLTISLFTLILSTGLGSMLSDRLLLDRPWKLLAWAALTSAYIVSLPLWMPPLLLAFDGATLIARASLCIAVIAPAGLLMGFAFPTGMRFASQIDRRPTPWFWGINGAAGVLASVMAVGLSIAAGISATLYLGALCYFLLIPAGLFVFGALSERGLQHASMPSP